MIGTNKVIDLSHHNGTVDLAKAKADGIAGVIHKATQGTGFKDPAYISNRKKAKDAGLLFGAYHFGVEGVGAAQADFFLSVAKPEPGDLLVLDFEKNTSGGTMTIEEAHDFITRIREVTGRFPGLYAGHFLKELLGTRVDPLLRNCWLWHAQYGPKPVIQRTWANWTFWQYTDGRVGPEPRTVNGVGPCDRDTFNGTAAELKKFWAGASKPLIPSGGGS